MTVTIILPTYNEAQNINPLILEIRKYVPNASILVVDDNSPDETAKKVKNAKVLLRLKNRGLTNSLADGIANTKTDVVAWMDCDFSHPPEVIPQLLDAIADGADIAIATRFRNMAKKNREHSTITGLTNALNITLVSIFGSRITDYTTGFLAIRRNVLNQIPLRGNYGEYCIDLLVRAQKAGYRIQEIPYESPPRLHGYSKTSPDISTFLHHGYGYVYTVIRLLLNK